MQALFKGRCATFQTTMDKMRSVFAVHGLPEVLVTDNGSVFTSAKFELFCAIKHVTSSPYHPSTNRLAERAVQSLKDSVKESSGGGGSMESSIARFLFQSRLTPHCTTAELLLNRRPRSLLVCLHPSVGDRACQNQERQTRGHDLQVWSRTLAVGERVLVKNFRSGHK